MGPQCRVKVIVMQQAVRLYEFRVCLGAGLCHLDLVYFLAFDIETVYDLCTCMYPIVVRLGRFKLYILRAYGYFGAVGLRQPGPCFAQSDEPSAFSAC